MTVLKRSACSVSLLALAVGGLDPGAALAQTVNDVGSVSGGYSANIDEIVVTARRSIDTPPEEIKRSAVGIVDSITSATIERTSDMTLPEALDRVVGVSSDAYFGTADAGYVSLRGFDSRYNSMEIDGNPIWFSSQNNRGAQIGLFPSAIVKETSVYKTVTPDQDGNSVGGHIALRTLRAFDGGTDPYLTIGGRIGFFEQQGTVEDGPSGRLYGAGKFTFGPDKRFGLVLGANYQVTRGADVYGGVDGYTQVDAQDQVNGNLYDRSQWDKYTANVAIFAKLETRITDQMYAFISGNIFDETKRLYLQRSAAFIAATTGRTITPTGPGQASFTGGEGQVREFDYDMGRKAKVVGVGLDYRLAELASLSLRGNYTNFSNDTLTRHIGNGFRLSGLSGTYDLNGDVPSFTASDPARYNVASNWIFSNAANSTTAAAYNRTQPLRDKVYALGATLNYNNQARAEGFGASGGINWTRLDRSFDQTQVFYSLPAGSPVLNLANVSEPGATMEGNAAAKQDWDRFWTYMYANGVSRTETAPTTDYFLKETVLAGHVVGYFSGPSFRILAGARYERTRDVTDTANLVRGLPLPTRRSTSYGNLLPNVQVTFDPIERLRLRGAFTKTIGRPDFADFAPGLTTTFDANGVPLNIGTNPNLGPRVSTNFDASLEYYFPNGILSVALFRKKLANETFNQRTEVRDQAGALTAINTIPLNTGSASVNGLEATAAMRRLTFLPAPLDGFGISANFTYLDGTWNVVFSDGTRRSVGGLRNQPKWLANLQLSYDAGPLDFNVNYRLRGRTFTGTFGTTALGDRWIESSNALDLQANFAVVSKLTLTLDARNLTSSYIKQTTGLNRSVFNSVGLGRSFFAGLRYRY